MVVVALLGNGCIAVCKLIVAMISGSAGMLAESFHSIADTGNQAMLLVGIRLSERPANPKHPFGYGMERYFWAFCVAVIMFSLGSVFSLYEGVHRILAPAPVEDVGLSLVVLGLAAIFEVVPWGIALREFLRTKGKRGMVQMAAETKDMIVLTVLLEDTAALVGVGIAAGGLLLAHFFGMPIFDAVACLLIGVLLALVAFVLARESKAMLIGESASREDVRLMTSAILSVPEVEGVVDILTMHLGPHEILVNLNLKFQNGLDTIDIEQAVDTVEGKIRHVVPAANRIFVEAESLPHRRSGVFRPITEDGVQVLPGAAPELSPEKE